ncbi:MAG: hypothetical protein OXF93_11920 [Acidobacteria bacterium]|nr:hypothetical protein [Acidobacteriota bacterium]
MKLLRRSFEFDVLECPRCGGRLQLIAVIEDPAVIERILRHLGLPTDIPEARPARPPPMPFLLDGLATAGATTRSSSTRALERLSSTARPARLSDVRPAAPLSVVAPRILS